jgi:hypothetical protein
MSTTSATRSYEIAKNAYDGTLNSSESLYELSETASMAFYNARSDLPEGLFEKIKEIENASGYQIRWRTKQAHGMGTRYICCKSAKKKSESQKSGQRKNASMANGCPHSIALRYSNSEVQWEAHFISAIHNHKPVNRVLPDFDPTFLKVSQIDRGKPLSSHNATLAPFLYVFRAANNGAALAIENAAKQPTDNSISTTDLLSPHFFVPPLPEPVNTRTRKRPRLDSPDRPSLSLRESRLRGGICCICSATVNNDHIKLIREAAPDGNIDNITRRHLKLFCRLHSRQDALLEWKVRGWPMHDGIPGPDLSLIHERCGKLFNSIMEDLKGDVNAFYLQKYSEIAIELLQLPISPAQRRKRIEMEVPISSYWGDDGYSEVLYYVQVRSHNLRDDISLSITQLDVKALGGPATFWLIVVAPEIVVRLMAQDLQMEYNELVTQMLDIQALVRQLADGTNDCNYP